MGDGYEQSAHAGATFVLTMPRGANAPLTDDGVLRYDSVIRVGEPGATRGPGEVRIWRGQLRGPAGATDAVQVCCKAACEYCSPVPPCTIIVEPLIGHDKQIEIAASVTHGMTAGREELRFPGGKRVPILVGAALDQQLKPWHDAVFGAARQVVYHLYHLGAETSPSRAPAYKELHLEGKVLAIPVEPTPPDSGPTAPAV